jgi:hypothetical protein
MKPARASLRGVAIAIIALLAAPALLHAHSWYPFECCSDRDCFPVAVEDVQVSAEGYTLADGTFISFKETRPSPDGQYHVCRRQDGKGAVIRMHKKPACFWAPVVGS